MKITFDRKSTKFILDAFKDKIHPECIFCTDGITEKNLGVITNEGYGCSDLICLIKYTEKIIETNKT